MRMNLNKIKSFSRALVISVMTLLCAFPVFASSGTAYVEVDSNIKGAVVSINGKSVGVTPCRVEVKTGWWFNVEIWASGYTTETHKDCCIFAEGSVMKIYSNLKQAPTTGSISVKTSNVSGASVYLDGRFKGYTPYTINNVSPGYHTVKVSKEYCKDESQRVYVTAGKEEQVNFTLKMTQVDVKVTNVKNVGIYLDGIYKGTAPLTIKNITPGYHTLRASKGNFDDETINFYIREGETKTAEFTMNTADLEIKSNVTGADVYIDGNRVGATPLILKDLEPGQHTVKVSKKHYETKTSTVHLTGGYISTKEFYQEKISGYLSVDTSPAEASVSLNGREISKNRYELDEGTYTIKMKAFGYEELTDTITIYRNDYTTATEVMDRAPFRISSFTASAREFNPNNKNVHNTTRFSWSVNGPEDGEIIIYDEYGYEEGSIRVNFNAWNGSTVWDGKISGVPLSDGTYTATLTGGMESKSLTFTINSKINDYDQKSRGQGLFFDVGKTFGSSYDGVDFGLTYYFGGEHLYGGVGADFCFAKLNGSPSKGSDFMIADFDVTLGGSFNFYKARPFIEASAGYYFTAPLVDNVNAEKPHGFSLSATAGCDFVFDWFNIGAFYKATYYNGLGWAHEAGASLGISF